MLGIIGGTGLTEIDSFEIKTTQWIDTPYGNPSAALVSGELNGVEVVFLARHGSPHVIPPHLVNYRANLFAMKQLGVRKIIAVNAVGGIHEALGPAQIAVPDQIIDYTYGREHTIYDGSHDKLDHIDFTYPYSEELRLALIAASKSLDIEVLGRGVYGATQGPRLETAAEINKLKNDGCDLVGMTGMPEAVLARELGLEYACIALSVNWCAGMTEAIITMDDIHNALNEGMGKVLSILGATVKAL